MFTIHVLKNQPLSLPFYLQCSYCLNEAQYNCCWNANYCNETCQQNHWPEHMKNCTQVQQQQQQQQQQQPPNSARTPGPPEVSGGTPIATAAPIQFHPSMALMSNASAAAVSGTPVFTSGAGAGVGVGVGIVAGAAGQEAHHQGLLYMTRSAAVRTPQGQQPQGVPHQQHIGVVGQIAGSSLAVSDSE